MTAPAFNNVFSAIIVISEIGVSMESFPLAKHLCSWVGLAPTNNESAGKKKSVRVSITGRYIKPGAVALAQLDKLGSICEKRNIYGEKLSRGIEDLPGIKIPKILNGCKSSYWFYMFRIDEKGGDRGVTGGRSCCHTNVTTTPSPCHTPVTPLCSSSW